MSKTYQEILKTMTDEFTERTGMEIDAASDIGIRMQVLAGEIYDLLTEIDDLTQPQERCWNCTQGRGDFHVSKETRRRDCWSLCWRCRWNIPL